MSFGIKASIRTGAIPVRAGVGTLGIGGTRTTSPGELTTSPSELNAEVSPGADSCLEALALFREAKQALDGLWYLYVDCHETAVLLGVEPDLLCPGAFANLSQAAYLAHDAKKLVEAACWGVKT